MSKDNYVEQITNIDDDFAKWYTDIVIKAKLADYTETKGCISIRPYGFEIWENIKNYADKKFKEIGIKNAYFPLLIPENLLQKEKDHIEGFSPEVAWVNEIGDTKLDERLCIRPTSETIICSMYSKWLSSYRDLPFLYNQWCNVLRWEKETRPFLRSREFLWQEGHTIHETEKEAKEFTLKMLEIYSDILENLLAIPVVKGKKTESEKFAGAKETYTIETLMKDGKALQSATSHYFGQNFSKPFNIKFQNRDGKEEYAYQTSFGITTRLIGAIIMSHGDDRGLKLPPKIAPIQVNIIPIKTNDEKVMNVVNEIYKELNGSYRIEIDDRDNYSVGYKFNDSEMRGIPLRIEIGPRDLENNKCIIVRRDTLEKIEVELDNIKNEIDILLKDIQNNMYKMCEERMKEKTSVAKNIEEFESIINNNQGFIKVMWCGDNACEEKINNTSFCSTKELKRC